MAVANARGVALIAYECGQHPANGANNALFDAANRDARIGAL